MTTNTGTIFTCTVVRVDIDTGEILTKFQATGKNSKYIKISITKKTTYNANKTRGYIEYTIKYRRNPQGELPFNNIP